MVPRSALAGAPAAVAARQASAVEAEPEKIERVRDTSDLMWKMSRYGEVDCQCGSKIRVPPNYRAGTIRCPHCGTVNSVPRR